MFYYLVNKPGAKCITVQPQISVVIYFCDLHEFHDYHKNFSQEIFLTMGKKFLDSSSMYKIGHLKPSRQELSGKYRMLYLSRDSH